MTPRRDAAGITHGEFVGAPGATIGDPTTWTTPSRAGIDLIAHTSALDTMNTDHLSAARRRRPAGRGARAGHQ